MWKLQWTIATRNLLLAKSSKVGFFTNIKVFAKQADLLQISSYPKSLFEGNLDFGHVLKYKDFLSSLSQLSQKALLDLKNLGHFRTLMGYLRNWFPLLTDMGQEKTDLVIILLIGFQYHFDFNCGSPKEVHAPTYSFFVRLY